MKILEKWYIKIGKRDANHPVIKYLNDKYGTRWDGSAKYYADLGNRSDCYSHENGYFWDAQLNNKEISLDYFKAFILNKKSNKIIQIY